MRYAVDVAWLGHVGWEGQGLGGGGVGMALCTENIIRPAVPSADLTHTDMRKQTTVLCVHHPSRRSGTHFVFNLMHYFFSFFSVGSVRARMHFGVPGRTHARAHMRVDLFPSI